MLIIICRKFIEKEVDLFDSMKGTISSNNFNNFNFIQKTILDQFQNFVKIVIK